MKQVHLILLCGIVVLADHVVWGQRAVSMQEDAHAISVRIPAVREKKNINSNPPITTNELSVAASKDYNISSDNSFTGGGTYCQDEPAGALLAIFNTCSSGNGPATAHTVTVSWYENTSNSTSGGTQVYQQTGASTGTSSTVTFSYTPSTATIGTLYYYVTLSVPDNTVCGFATTLTTSGTQAVTITSSVTSATWLTTGTSAWTTATNWSTGIAPDYCTDVTIPSGGTQPVINGGATVYCHSLTVNSGALLTVGTSTSSLGTIDIAGDLTNNGTINDAWGFTDLYGEANNWGGTGVFLSGATQEGYINIQDGAAITLTSDQTVKTINALSSPGTTGNLYLGTHTLTVTSTLNNVFNLHYNTGIVDLQGGGSIDTAKSDYGTGTLWIDEATSNFSFNLVDNYYNVWFSNSAGATKFGSSAAAVTISNNMWIKTGTLDLSSAGANSIYVGGDFTNDATFNSATATIDMDGLKAQGIRGASITTFNNLIIDNTSTGVTMYQNENVSGTLTLTQGPLYLFDGSAGHTLDIQNAASSAIVRTNGYVVSEQDAAINNSILEWDMGTSTGSYIFPFGANDGSYIPVTMNITTGGSNLKLSTRATTDACSSPSGGAGTCNQPWAGVSDVAAVSNMYDPSINGDGSIQAVIDRWWNITPNATVPTADVTFSYRGVENTMAAVYQTGNIAVQHWTGTYWNDGKGGGNGTYSTTGSTGVTTGIGSATASGLSQFSPFVLVGKNAPLPVELLSFTARPNLNYVNLLWETASETNNNYFTIERSNNGIDFNSIEIVKGAGTTTQAHNYSTMDSDPLPGTSYYRLMQTDNDGRNIYSKIIAVYMEAHQYLHVYPVPAKDNIDINWGEGICTSCSTIGFIKIYNTVGKCIFKKEINTAVKHLSVNVTSFSKGIYYLVFIDNSTVQTKKFEKK